jgi:hypothetical protein
MKGTVVWVRPNVMEVDMTVIRNAEHATQIRAEDGIQVPIKREEEPIPIFSNY